ncbi:MAG TPA: AAA family ATPase [Candidatus Limnocylindrales bacterium]
MRIGRLRLRGIRQYADREIELAPGLTVVRGPNEAGKSTIQRAIELAFTRRVTSSNSDLDALTSWTAADDTRPEIELDFVTDDEEGSRNGSLVKSFRGQRGTVRLEYNGEVVSDPARADELLAELTGIPSEAFFRSTASVRHHELAEVARDEAALRDRLQASISGADRGTSRARRQLDRAIRDLTTRGPKNPGRVKVAEDGVTAETAAVEEGEAALAQLERDRDTLVGARERRVEAEKGLGERRAMLEKARQAERLQSERVAAQERYERYRQAVQVRDELAALGDAHPSRNPLPVLRQAVERLRRLDTTIRELKAALAGEIEVHFELPPEPTWRPIARASVVLVVLGAVVGAAWLVGSVSQGGALPIRYELPITVLYLGGAILGLGLVLTIVAFYLRRSYETAMALYRLRGDEIDRRLRGRSQLEEELVQAELDTEQQLASLEIPNLDTASDLLAKEEEHVARIDRLAAQLEGLIGKEPSDALPSLRDAAALEIEQKTAAVEALGPIAKEPRARERLEAEVRDAEMSLDRARDDEANARARVEANQVDAEQVTAHAERLAGWREELAALQRRVRVYETTLAAIERAEQATMKTATRYLEQRMVRDLERATAGRYRRVRVDDKTLGIEVFAPEKRDWVDVGALSQGTLDLVYLAARIGLVRLVTGDRRPPLVFDDPFVTLDGERATRALTLLKELTSDFQVIYLTTSDRYDAVADAVVELTGPTAVDDGAQAAATPTRG